MQNIKGLHNLFYILFLLQYCDLAKSGFFGFKKHIDPKIFSNLLASWLLKRAKGKPFGLPKNFFLDTNKRKKFN